MNAHSLLWTAYSLRPSVRRQLHVLENFSRLSPEQQRHVLGKRLHHIVQVHASRSYGKALWGAASGVSANELLSSWEELPVVTKADLRNQFHPDVLRAHLSSALELRTGGSTGEPTRFLHDPEMQAATSAARYHARKLAGWRPGSRTIAIWGSERDIQRNRSFRRRVFGRVANLLMVDGFHLSSLTVDRLLALLSHRSPASIYGFSSMLQYVAQEVLARHGNRWHGSISAAWNGGEMLLEDQSRDFEKAFGTPIRDLYGGRELSAIAVQASHLGPLAILRPLIFLEVVGDDGRAVPAGTPGRILVTSTACAGTPFIRYEIGDYGEFAGRDLTETGILALSKLHGRRGGIIRLPDGTAVGAMYWNHLFKDYDGVSQFQVCVKQGSSIELRLVGRPLSPGEEHRLRTAISSVVGKMRVDITSHERIPRTAQGKLLQVVEE